MDVGVVGVATSQGDLFTSWCLRWLDTFFLLWKGFEKDFDYASLFLSN